MGADAYLSHMGAELHSLRKAEKLEQKHTDITIENTIVPFPRSDPKDISAVASFENRSIKSTMSLMSAKNKLDAVLNSQMNESEDSIV